LAGYVKKMFGPRLPEIAPVPTHVIRTRTVPIAALEWPAAPTPVVATPAPVAAVAAPASDGVPTAPMPRGAGMATARIPALPRDDGVVRRAASTAQSTRIAIPVDAPVKRRTRTVQIPALGQPPTPTPRSLDATDAGWGDDLDSWMPAKPVVVA